MSKDTSNASEWRILKYFWRAGLQHRNTFLFGLLVPVGTVMLGTLFPFYVGKLLADLSLNPDNATRYIPYLFAIGLTGIAANRYGTALMFQHQARVMSNLQQITLNTLLKQSSSFHNNRIAGKLVSDALDFPQAYNMLANAFLVSFIPLGITIILGVVLVMAKSWLLGLILLGMVGAVVGVALIQSHMRRPLRKIRIKATKAVTAHLADTIVNNQTVKTFARESAELATHKKLNHTLLDIRLKDWSSGAKAGNDRMFGLLVFQLIFTIAIIHMVRQDSSLLAVGIFAFTYSVTLSNQLFNINSLIRQTEEALLQAQPFMEIIDQQPTIIDKPGSKQLHVKRGEIRFDNVGFHYQDTSAKDSVFTNLDLHIQPGEKVGLVGPSGGGKSTLTRLLLRFDDVQKGCIMIDDQVIADIAQTSLREAIAYVPQEPLMFHRSVFENIAYGKPGATLEQVQKAAKQANAHDFIAALPDGYDTLVGERGVKLSGGQRQRVAIARAILKDAPILILDEATSALDSESEVLIQQALLKLMQNRTTLVIAHRLSTIQKMDRILVLEDGQITEEGTHKALLQHKGTYASLWKHQSGGFLEE
ncbi:MAG TPA: ABC transporter ATP-binding protein [Candidatus Saccharimonadales bacterium]